MGRGVLFLVSGFIVIFGIIQVSVQERQQGLVERSSGYFYKEQSRNIAGAAMEIALARLNENAFALNEADVEGTIKPLLGGKGNIEVTIEYFDSRAFLTIKGISKHAGEKTVTTIKAEANRISFSHFAYYTNIEPTIWFVTGDILNGPVHTNGTFHIDGDPIFNGEVTSPNDPEVKSGSDPVYNGGRDFNADPIPMPTAEDIADISDKAQSGGLWFDNDKIKVEFKENGTADISEYKCGNWDQVWEWNRVQGEWEQVQICRDWNFLASHNYDLKANDFNGIISSNGAVEVEGTLDGNITLHSHKDITVTGDVKYENTNFKDPQEDNNPNNDDEQRSNDLLGLVSADDIIVEDNAHTDHGSNDVTIHGSLMALGSFRVEGYNDGDSRGYLNVVGGVIQNRRGPVGLVNGSGYLKNYNYDVRFLQNSTNGFPRTNKFQIDSWRETTKIIHFNN